MSAAIQTAFARGLFSAAPPPPGLTAWNGGKTQRRYGVYSNNVTASLTAALASRFPATESIVGTEFFKAMARAFIEVHPPRSPVLLAYGDDFPEFAAAFEPAGELVYLPDVMRLEVARGRAYHAADVAPLDPATLSTIDPARLETLVFRPHPALSILSSLHPVVTIWAMNSGARAVAPIEEWQGEHALIARPRLIVETTLLAPGGAIFLRNLAAGDPLATAAEVALRQEARFDLSENLEVLLRSGAFAAIAQDETDEDRHRP